MRHVSNEDVKKAISFIRNSCSARFHNIPVSYIKPDMVILISPLCHIINESMKNYGNYTLSSTKDKNPKKSSEYRLISVLPILPKTNPQQMNELIERHNLLKDNQSGLRKRH